MTSSVDKDLFEINFSDMPLVTLFTGRKNGRKARKHYNIRNANGFIFKANENQVITSSYFLGLVGDELTCLLLDLRDINELLEKVDTDGLNETSKNECVRAIKRGLSPQDVSL
jgi:hypothetical protein